MGWCGCPRTPAMASYNSSDKKSCLYGLGDLMTSQVTAHTSLTAPAFAELDFLVDL